MMLSEARRIDDQLTLALGPYGFEFHVRPAVPDGYEIAVTTPDGTHGATVATRREAELLLQKGRPGRQQ